MNSPIYYDYNQRAEQQTKLYDDNLLILICNGYRDVNT